MAGMQANSGQDNAHIEAGYRYLENDRPDDAAGEFMLAIRASGATPNGDALVGLARAYDLGSAETGKTLAAYEDARPYLGTHWEAWVAYVRAHLGFKYDHDEGFQAIYQRSGGFRRDFDKLAEQHLKRGKAEIDQGIQRFGQLLGTGDFYNACRAADAMVSLADWLDDLEVEHSIPGTDIRRSDNPFRDMAVPLYKAVADSSLEAMIPDAIDDDSDLAHHLRDEIIGRARRQLAFRGKDGIVLPKPSRGASGGIPLWAWVVGGVAYLILFFTVRPLAALLAIVVSAIAAYFIYRRRAQGQQVPVMLWAVTVLGWVLTIVANLWLGILLGLALLGGVAYLIYQRSNAAAPVVSPEQ